MKKSQRRKAKNSGAKLSKAMNKAKKTSQSAKKQARKVKARANNMVGKAKKRLSKMKKTSTKALTNAKHSIYATEKEIRHYVKKNPVKSVSTVALTALIAGFVASRYRK